MNILFLDSGKHTAPSEFTESFAMQRAFKKLGVESVIWGPAFDNYNVDFSELEKEADYIFLIENYNFDWLPKTEIKNSKKTKIFWSIDSHYVLERQKNICRELNIDILLNATEEYLPCFEDIVDEMYWFPNAYPDDIIFPMGVEKKFDIGFCGSIAGRGDYFDRLKKYNIRIDTNVFAEEMVRAVNSYRIHFNQNVANDINFRTFETPGCGTFLLTNHHPNIGRLFEVGKEIVTYNSFDELENKIRYYIDHHDEREKIAKNGFERVKKDHTYFARCKELLKLLKNSESVFKKFDPKMDLNRFPISTIQKIYYCRYIHSKKYTFGLLISFFKSKPKPYKIYSIKTIIVFALKCLFKY